ncbi:hypothetical protein VSQ32_16720 [Lachnospiraceae bacterium KK002]
MLVLGKYMKRPEYAGYERNCYDIVLNYYNSSVIIIKKYGIICTEEGPIEDGRRPECGKYALRRDPSKMGGDLSAENMN